MNDELKKIHKKIIVLVVIIIVIFIIFLLTSGLFDISQIGRKPLIEIVGYDVEDYGWGKGVTATLKNNYGKLINILYITVKFRDSNGNVLHTQQTTISDFPNSYTKKISVSLSSSAQYFKNVDWSKIGFDWSILY